MIRRPATIISLGDEEVQCFLQHLLLRTLPVDFDQLRLGDPAESYDEYTLDDSSSDGFGVSSDSDGEFDHHAPSVSVPGSSCVRNNAGSQGFVASAAPAALPAPLTATLLHRLTYPTEFSATTTPQISTMLPRHRAGDAMASASTTRGESGTTVSPLRSGEDKVCPVHRGLSMVPDDRVIDQTTSQGTFDKAATGPGQIHRLEAKRPARRLMPSRN